MVKETRIRKKYRLPPCPSYDVERIESWLQDMSKEGLMLEKESKLFGFLCFLPVTPRAVRYRLEPKPKADGSSSDIPSAEAREIAAEYGWEFVDAYGSFYIYRATDSNAREMNTELSVQATSLKTVKRSFFWGLLFQLIHIFIVFHILLREPFRCLVTFGYLYPLSILILLAAVLTADIIRVSHIRKLQKKLNASIPLDHGKPWRKSAKLYRMLKIGSVLFYILILSLLLTTCTAAIESGQLPTGNYPGDPPFVTIADLCPEGEFTPVNLLNRYNEYTALSTSCAPVAMDWWEYGELTTPDGQILSGSLIVDYYETTAPWIAKGLAADFLRQAKRHTHYHQCTAPEIDVDYVVSYMQVFPTILIRHGNIVVQAQLSVESETGLSMLENWAQLMAQRLNSQ